MIYSAAARSEEIAQRASQLQVASYARPGLSQGITSGPSKREQIFSTYVGIFFPAEMEARSSVDLWHYLICNFSALPIKTEMLEKALAALACVYLGKQNRDERFLKYGVQLYNSAIRSMAGMITRDAYCDDIIYTTVVFQEIEVSCLISVVILPVSDLGMLQANPRSPSVLRLTHYTDLSLSIWSPRLDRPYRGDQCDPEPLPSSTR